MFKRGLHDQGYHHCVQVNNPTHACIVINALWSCILFYSWIFLKHFLWYQQLLIVVYVYAFAFGGPTTQFPRKSSKKAYSAFKCLALSCLVSCQVFLTLNYPVYHFAFWAFMVFLFLYTFSFLLNLCLAMWLGNWPLENFSPPSLSSSPSLYSLCLSVLPMLSPGFLLAIQLFYKPIRCFRREK